MAVLKRLARKAKEFGMQLVPAQKRSSLRRRGGAKRGVVSNRPRSGSLLPLRNQSFQCGALREHLYGCFASLLTTPTPPWKGGECCGWLLVSNQLLRATSLVSCPFGSCNKSAWRGSAGQATKPIKSTARIYCTHYGDRRLAAIVFAVVIAAVVITIPLVIVLLAAVISVPIAVVELAALIPGSHPASAGIRCAGPVAFMPFVMVSYGVPVARNPQVFRAGTDRNNSHSARRGRRPDPDSNRDLGAKHRHAGQQSYGEQR
jgi:hypothetical protein